LTIFKTSKKANLLGQDVKTT